MRFVLICWLSIIALAGPDHARAAEHIMANDSTKSIFDLLSQEDVLHINIKTDITKFLDNKNTHETQKALIEIKGDLVHPDKWIVDISARGKHRRKTCDFPPVKLKFKKSVLKNNHLEKFNSLKLVTHCGSRAEAEELLLKEYLVYKLYNNLTPHSFRVQLVEIDWQDSNNQHNIGIKWGFIIEHKDEVAHRLSCTEHHGSGVFHHEMNTSNASISYMFQYMIGNHDWHLESGRNLNFIHDHISDEVLAIPYDFDFSMLVDAYYISLEWELKGNNMRVYLGEFTDEENEETIAFFKSKKKELLKIIKSFKPLTRSTRFEMTSYIRSFYAHLNKPLQRVNDVQSQ